MGKISLIIPVYNEADKLEEVIEKYIADLKQAEETFALDYEMIIIDDASSDGTFDVLAKEFKLHTSIKILTLAERSGKQAALTAGMDAASGDIIILADVDKLNPIGILTQVIGHYFEGNQIVYAYREKLKNENRKFKITNMLVNLAARSFSVEGKFLGRTQIQLFSRDVADIIVALPNKNKFIRNVDNWIGYDILKVEYPSEYTKEEIKIKVKQQNQKRRHAATTVVKRDKVREHTPSTIYSIGCLAAAVIMITTNIILLTSSLTVGFGWWILLWALPLLLLSASLLFFARAVLIRNIGIIHKDDEREIYNLAD